MAMRAPGSRLFTTSEAAVLTGLSLDAVNRSIDRKMLPAIAGKWTGNVTRLLDLRALMSLILQRRLANRFGPELRRELFNGLETSARNRVFFEAGFLTITIDLREPRRELAASLRALRRSCNSVISDPDILDGEPVFRGTRVPVHLIATLLGDGLSEADLLERYPRLTAEMVRLTPIYAAAYPLRGRARTYLWYENAPIQSTYRKLATIEVR